MINSFSQILESLAGVDQFGRGLVWIALLIILLAGALIITAPPEP